MDFEYYKMKANWLVDQSRWQTLVEFPTSRVVESTEVGLQLVISPSPPANNLVNSWTLAVCSGGEDEI